MHRVFSGSASGEPLCFRGAFFSTFKDQTEEAGRNLAYPRSQNHQTVHTSHSLCKVLSSAEPGQSSGASSSCTLCHTASHSPSTVPTVFFPYGCEWSPLLQHAPSSPLSPHTKMGGRGARSREWVCVLLSPMFSLLLATIRGV